MGSLELLTGLRNFSLPTLFFHGAFNMVGPGISQNLPVYENLKVEWAQIIGMYLTGAIHVGINLQKKRPLFANVPRLALFLGAGYLGANVLMEYKNWRRRRTQALVEDYIRLHPDDFPLVQPKKYKDVVLPWHPNRNL